MKHRQMNPRRLLGRSVKVAATVAVIAVGVATFQALGGTAGSGFELTRVTVDGGGAMRATGGGFELSGTIGQPDAGLLTGVGFELTGGFWFAVATGDQNEDGAVDLVDYSVFEACMTGPDGGAPGAGCEVLDADRNGTIDLADFAVIQATFSGH